MIIVEDFAERVVRVALTDSFIRSVLTNEQIQYIKKVTILLILDIYTLQSFRWSDW